MWKFFCIIDKGTSLEAREAEHFASNRTLPIFNMLEDDSDTAEFGAGSRV